jgi:hypothetical protein
MHGCDLCSWATSQVMALFSLSSLFGLMNDTDVASIERLSFVFTLMLTATAYSLVIAEQLPSLGYLTMLDQYILGTFGFIFTVACEIASIYWTHAGFFSDADELSASDVDDSNQVDTAAYCVIADVSMWVLFHAASVVYVVQYVLPHEHKKP